MAGSSIFKRRFLSVCMSNLRQLFANPFQGQSISDDALRIFTHDHVQKLSEANRGDEFNARLTDTVAAFTAFGGVVTSTELGRSLLIIATSEMFLRWNACREWMADEGERHIINKAGRESAVYAQFFPEGLEEMGRITLEHAGRLLDRFITVVTSLQGKHGELLGQAFVMTLAQHRKQFYVARHAHLALRGEFLVGVLDREIARGALEIQLFDNALAMLQRHRKQPLHAMEFFHPGLLEYVAPAADSPWVAGLATKM